MNIEDELKQAFNSIPTAVSNKQDNIRQVDRINKLESRIAILEDQMKVVMPALSRLIAEFENLEIVEENTSSEG